MRKILCLAIPVLLAICALFGCTPTTREAAQEPSLSMPAEPTFNPPFTPSATLTQEPSSYITLNIADEPPLDELSLSIAVPDFLDDEQQLLYRRAYCVYSHLFGGDTGEVNIWQDGDKYPNGINDVEHDGIFYTKAVGRYAVWADFDALVHSVFTNQFWFQRNGGADYESYTNIDGSLYFVWASRGMYYYRGNIPDQFELISKTENEIAFTLIGHYIAQWPPVQREDESAEDWNKRLESGYDYTLEFPIKLVRTQDGWRFDEFHSAMADQREPEDQ